MLKSGNRAPNLTLQTIEGQTIDLAHFWRQEQNLLLVFLRHLGWLPWRDHVAQLRSSYEKIQALQAEVVVISFGAEFWVKVWLEQTQAPFPLLLDQERQAYLAYGLEESATRSWGVKNLWYYAKAMLQGRQLPSSHGDDVHQLGGDFIIDRQGILRYTHPSQEPTDRPSIEKITAVLGQLVPQ